MWQAARTSSPTKIPPSRSPSSSTTSSTGRRGSFKQREFSNIILNECPPIVSTGNFFPEQLCVWVCGLLLHRCLVDPMSNHCHAGLERGSLACVLIGGKLHQCDFFSDHLALHCVDKMKFLYCSSQLHHQPEGERRGRNEAAL